MLIAYNSHYLTEENRLLHISNLGYYISSLVQASVNISSIEFVVACKFIVIEEQVDFLC